MQRIFVYGTLKRGCKNHVQLRGQTFIAPARTFPGYRLHDLGDYPGMIEDTTDREGVVGEIWEVNPHALARLDAFEGIEEKLYARRVVRLQPPHDGENVEGYIYLRPVEDRPALGPEWIE